MDEERIRRFQYSEIILHWANAVPFMILMTTGAVIMLSRFTHIDAQILTPIKNLHKIAAVAWVVLLTVSFLFIGPKMNFRNLKELLTWRLDDLRWLVSAVRSIYNKNVKVPEAGKFNTGQKINSLWVVFYYFAFPVTGFIMMYHGSILLAWYLHASFFFTAVSTITGHLYLGFLNPSTRVGLGGIFNGWVPKYYVVHHHALTLSDIAQARQDAAGKMDYKKLLGGSFMRAEIVIFLLAIVLGVIGFNIFYEGKKSTLKKGFNSIITPDVLSEAHRIKEIDDCKKCHDYTGELKDEKCFKCHAKIKERMANKIGYHGTRTDPCRKCHREHPGILGKIIKLDDKKFDHNLAAYKLEGKHAQVKCEQCHKKRARLNAEDDSTGGYYIGVRYELCVDCHKDPHKKELGEKCITCHSVLGWKGKDVKFDHDRDSKYKLEGKHRTAKCVQCHKPKAENEPLAAAPFKNINYKLCTSCHKDPHNGDLSDKCDRCHNFQSWKGKDVRFDHDKDSKYKLEGKHKDAKCVKCHKLKSETAPLGSAPFKNIKHKLCTDCHKDPHNGDLSEKCEKCHNFHSWKGKDVKFNHDKDSKYKLEGKHEDVKCVKCHKLKSEKDPLGTAPFKNLKYNHCTDCHKDPHNSDLSDKCDKCHSAQGWKGKDVRFDHDKDSKYKLEGKHRDVKCVKCHKPKGENAALGTAPFKNLKYKLCSDCHKDPHKGKLGGACDYCHNVLGWEKKKK